MLGSYNERPTPTHLKEVEMFGGWVEFVPLGLVRILAPYCTRKRVGEKHFGLVRPGVMVEVKEKPISGPVIYRLSH